MGLSDFWQGYVVGALAVILGTPVLSASIEALRGWWERRKLAASVRKAYAERPVGVILNTTEDRHGIVVKVWADTSEFVAAMRRVAAAMEGTEREWRRRNPQYPYDHPED